MKCRRRLAEFAGSEEAALGVNPHLAEIHLQRALALSKVTSHRSDDCSLIENR